jgi:hypothetical protein
MRGFGSPPVDYALNVSHIVGFCKWTFNADDGKEVEYVHLDTFVNRGLFIAGTFDELLAQIKDKEQGK